MTSVLLPSLAVAASWLLFAALILGCGFLARAGMLRLFAVGEPRPRPAAADLWIGLSLVIVYLLVWNDVAAVTWAGWLLPVVGGTVGLALGLPRLRRPRVGRGSAAVLGLVALAVLLLANQALGAADDYDFGLYHLGAIHYAEHYSAIPGLANLQTRFGAGDGNLLLAAFLDHGPWAGAGTHLVDGLLAAMLAVELGARFAFRSLRTGFESFTDRLALLLVPATVVLVVWAPTRRLASPNLDFAAFVLVVVGVLYLAEAVERGFRPTPVLGSSSALAAVSATRPLYWLMTGFVIAAAAVVAHRARPSAWLRALGLAGIVPVATALAWSARQSLLSGYPLFPTTMLRLPVDWRVPISVVDFENGWDHAWARQPGLQPSIVLGSWHWLSAFWLKHTFQNPDVAIPFLLLGCLAPALLARRRDAERQQRTMPMLAVVVPCLATLVAWFLIAPDPRFAWAPIWLVPLALTAWALPTHPGHLPLWLGAAVVIGVFLIVFRSFASGGISAWLVPSVLGSTLLLAGVVWAMNLADRVAAPLAIGVVVTAFLAGTIAVADIRGLDLIRATKGGPLGTPPNPTPTLIDVTTTAGLVVHQPAAGADQCWSAYLCVPQLEVQALTMRGRTLADGFHSAPP